MRSTTEFDRPGNPRKGANFLSIITFWYALKIFMVGRSRDLDELDLTEPLDEHKSALLGEKLSRNWSEELRKASKVRRRPSLTKVIIKTFRWDIIVYGVVLFIMEFFIRLPQPIFVGLFIRYFNVKNIKSTAPQYPPTWLMRIFYYFSKNQSRISQAEAFFFAACIMICSMLVVLMFHPYIMAAMHVGMQVRVACCSLIYRKALRINVTNLGSQVAGNAVNLMSNDVNRFDQAPMFLHYLWISPLQGILIFCFLYNEMGMASISGVLAVNIVIPIQILLSFATTALREKAAARTDERVRQMNEIVQAIQVIKMYAWEMAFAELISNLRKKELRALLLTSYIRGITMSFIMFTARFAIFLTVLVYVLEDNNITAEKVFVMGGYYMILRISFTIYFPQGINAIAETRVSISRIQKFLMIEEALTGDCNILDPGFEPQEVHGKSDRGDLKATSAFTIDSDSESVSSIKNEKSDLTLEDEKLPKIMIFRGIVKYGEVLCLENINTKMRAGQLIAIVGAVGSGKSCLLNLILGELTLFSGKISVQGRLSYASQEPWLFAGSVRQNIVFGKEFKADRYAQIIKVCALKRDFSIFPYGDKTIVGERGASLSGGQRARISLARAVYKEADIYLLDDPLSAVDIQVGQQLFEECLIKYLKGKIIVLVTHQLQYLKRADKLIILNEGTVQIQGSYDKIRKSDVGFAVLLEEATTLAGQAEPEKETDKVLKAISLSSAIFNSTIDIEGLKQGPKRNVEMRTLGAVKFANYQEYFSAGGNCCLNLILFILFLGAQVLGSGGDYFLGHWVYIEETKPKESFDRTFYIKIYSIIIGATVVVVLIRSLYFFTLCMRASLRLHNRMFESIIFAAMQFFHQNTSGRILNRFSKDLGQVDELLPNAFIDTVQIMLNLIGAIIIICMINVWFLIPVAVMLVIFYFLRKFYLKTSRSVKRLDGITRSPIFAHLNASLQGLPTIRINKAERVLVAEFDNFQDTHSSAWFMFLYTSRAFSMWLDWITAIFIGVVTFACVMNSQNVYGSDVGLMITQSIGLTGLIQWGMRQSAELENQMTSVERVLEFTRVEREPELYSKPDRKPPASWPKNGQIEFVNTTMRYSLTEPPVLKKLCITILPRQKVGIVGRTGAGKSSLISTLFRLAYFEGEIYIDYLDISVLGLHDLRHKISIIPQEPVLFNGTLRYNLDPFDEYNDDDILSSLIAVKHKDALMKGKECLNNFMAEGGQNVSVGQRQMICLARAILRNNKILVMDEATANVDVQTDKLIQTTIRQKFAQCTVLTIAHRLHTVMDSDKILVMDAGKAVEFDHPHVLLQNQTGFLSELVNKTGTGTASHLKRIAKTSYIDRQKDQNIVEEDESNNASISS